MSVKKRGLGRGLDALLSSVASAVDEEAGDQLRAIAVDQLQPGRHQPRQHFDAAALDALTESIRAQGVVQPIVVRSLGGDRYEIVAGERRWRAARQAGLQTVPAVIKTLDERGAMAVALVENIQRADLNPLEEADVLHKLIRDCGLTHEAVATAVGRSRTHVTNLLRLMELGEEVQQLIRNGHLSFGHAKVLLGVQGPRQAALARFAVERQLSVRQIEALVHADPAERPRAAAAPALALERQLLEKIGLPVRLKQSESGRGRLTVLFRNAAELESFIAKLH